MPGLYDSRSELAALVLVLWPDMMDNYPVSWKKTSATVSLSTDLWAHRRFDGPALFFGGPTSNLHALKALLEEGQRRGISPDAMISTGDLVAYCADAKGVIALMRDLKISFIRGNCEDQLAANAGDCGCGFATDSECDRLSSVWFAHAQKMLTKSDRDFLDTAPEGMIAEMNGLRLAVIHGAARQNNRFIFASTPARIKEHDLDLLGADGVIAGHSGLPFTQILNGRLWHNAGALGLPANDGTQRVWYSIIAPGSEPATVTIEHCALDYDARGAARAMAGAGLTSSYTETLLDGLWPNCEILPPAEAKMQGKALMPGCISYSRTEVPATRLLWPDFDNKPSLNPAKFIIPEVTLSGEPRAQVKLQSLETLWINTGTLCNLSCASCYIESTPRNDRLVYISAKQVRDILDEITSLGRATRTIGFTGGEPFMNPDFIEMLRDTLARGFDVLVLTNAMKPMRKWSDELCDLKKVYAERLVVRVSLDHFTAELHELERGPRTYSPTLDGLVWLAREKFSLAVAGRLYSGEPEGVLRAGYANLFRQYDIALDAQSPADLVLFPEMDMEGDVPEISENCWKILGKSSSSVMCSSSRMIVMRKGAEKPSVIACTLLPYEPAFDMGDSLSQAMGAVTLNHPYCAKFCVLGGASCKA